MNQFNSLLLLFSRLQREEVKALKKFLTTFEEGSADKGLKSLQLAVFLLENHDNCTKDKACEHLYGKKASKTFDKLILRLRDKVYEVLIMDININRRGAYNDTTRHLVDVRKKNMQAQLLAGKGMLSEAVRLCDKIIIKSGNNEFYDDLLQALQLKQRLTGLTLGKQHYQQLASDIDFYERCRKALQTASNWYNRLIVNMEFTSNQHNYFDLFAQAVSELQHEYRFTNSANIGYYLYLVQIEYQLATHRFAEAEAASRKLLELVNHNKAIYLKRRAGTAHTYLAITCLHLHQFKDSLVASGNARTCFAPNSFNAAYTLEIDFYSELFSGNTEKATAIIKELAASPTARQSPFQGSKWNYLYANMLTLQQKHREAHLLLQSAKEIERDKEGWNVGMRIHTILNQLDAKKFDTADMQIESMRKHIERTMKMKVVKKRNLIILKVLLELVKASFDFGRVWRTRKKYFELLAGNEPAYRWEIRSPELIVFHEWFEAKVNNEDYQLSVVH